MIDLDEARTLSNEAEYEAALAAVRPYFDDEEPDPKSEAGVRLERLCRLIEEYEDKFHALPAA